MDTKFKHNILSRLGSAGAMALLMGYTVVAHAAETVVDPDGQTFTLVAGDASLSKWILPAAPMSPDDNKPSKARADLGKKLFFDPRLSGTGQVTCASCHLPERGWADGLPTAVRFMGAQMTRASPTIVNLGHNSIFMWDGRMPSLEKQGVAGQGIKADINAGAKEPLRHVETIAAVKGYQSAFNEAYPGEGITKDTIGKAIAAFERTIVSNTSPFDMWLKGNDKALSEQQVRGFKLFVANDKGNCAVCHSAPNFTDNGFHNIGLKSFGAENADEGRFKQKAVPRMKGAFKTPTLRDITLTAPYFHDGSAPTLADVVEHYAQNGIVKTNLSPNLLIGALSADEKKDIVAFLQSLTSDHGVFEYPLLPK